MAAKVEEAVRGRLFGGDLAEVLERSPEPGPSLAVGDEQNPLGLRITGKLPRRDTL